MIRDLASLAIRKAAKAGFAMADVFYGPYPGPRLLIYHQFDAGLRREMEVSLETFVAQLDWLEEHGDIVPLEEALARRGEPDSNHLFVLTIDDGYRGMYERAYPILKERGHPFTLYLTTHPVETGRSLTPGGQADPLSWDQVNEMLEIGLMTLGAHTHTHPDLRQLAEDEIADELDRSNGLVEKRTGVLPRHFAYPKGIWSASSERLIREKYETAVLGAGAGITEASDFHRLSRVPVQRSDGTVFFRRKVTSGLVLEEAARRRLRKYRSPESYGQFGNGLDPIQGRQGSRNS